MSGSTVTREMIAAIGVAVAARRPNHSGWTHVTCPACLSTRRSLAVHLETGKFRCMRKDCGAWGRIDGDPRKAVAVENAMASYDGRMPPGSIPVDTPTPLLDDARAMLRRRHVPVTVWVDAGIHATTSGKFAGRVVVPCRGYEGLWGWVGRDWTDAHPMRYMTAPGMARDRFYNASRLDWTDMDNPVLVVEGVFDALPYWPNAVACLGKPGASQVGALRKAPCRRVAICLDGDAWEEARMLAMELRFDGVEAGFVRLPPREDPNSVDHDWLREEARRCITRPF